MRSRFCTNAYGGVTGMLNMHIFLVGMAGAGKTSLGRKLALNLGLRQNASLITPEQENFHAELVAGFNRLRDETEPLLGSDEDEGTPEISRKESSKK